MIRSLFLAPLALTAFTSTALAHFQLMDPKQDRTDALGKTGPCGPGQPAADAVVTTLPQGKTLSIKVDVTTPHSGYYRVVLSKDGTFPSVPGNACSTLNPNSNPSMPILKEIARTDANMGVHPIEVTLPNEPCPNCVLQVIQVMTDALPGPGNPNPNCFYYHCAKVNVAASVTPTDPGPTGPGPDAGPSDNTNNNSGGGSSGGCSTTGGQAGWALVALGALLPSLRRRSSN